MKKLITMILVAVLFLCGCSAPTETLRDEESEVISQSEVSEDSAAQEQLIPESASESEVELLELGTGTKENSLAILKFTINPEFELYVDSNACISRVRCLNEDAVTMFEGMTASGTSVIDIGYFEAIPTILDQAAKSGFLTEQTEQIKIDTTIRFDFTEDELQALAASFAKPVEEHCKNKGFGLTVELSTPVADTDSSLMSLTEPTGEPNSQRSLSWTDNGVSATGTTYYDENGLLCKYAVEYSDGSDFYEEYSDGTDVVYNKKTEANGDTLEQYYNENGIMIRQLQTKPDGFFMEKTFQSNGYRKSYIESLADGTYFEEHYSEANSLISSETRRCNEKGEIIYIKYEGLEKSYLFENGVLTYYSSDGVEITEPDELAMIAKDLGLT